MIEVKTQKRYKCDFCKKRSTRSVMQLHEKRCFRNPNRFCDHCENKGFIIDEPDPMNHPGLTTKIDCVYCSKFDKKKLEEIEKRESSLIT